MRLYNDLNDVSHSPISLSKCSYRGVLRGIAWIVMIVIGERLMVLPSSHRVAARFRVPWMDFLGFQGRHRLLKPLSQLKPMKEITGFVKVLVRWREFEREIIQLDVT